MSSSDANIWIIIFCMGVGTFVLRFSFLGLIGNRHMSPWLLRHLRYTAVAVMPALITPLVLWPDATGGQLDPARLAAASATLVIGLWTKNVILAILSGGVTLYTVLYFLPSAIA